MTVRNTMSGTAPLGKTAPLRQQPATSGALATDKPKGDELSISKAATAQLNANAPKVQTFEGKVLFGTGKDSVDRGSARGLDETLDKFVAAFQKLTPEQQKALLADPGFKIVVEGHASNLGNATKFDNQGLSSRRARSTAKYVTEYLKKKGVAIDASHVSAQGTGTPGSAKQVSNNDQADRSADIKILMPQPAEAPKAPPPKPVSVPPPIVLPTGLGSGEEEKPRPKDEPKAPPLPTIPTGLWKAPETDGSYVPPQDPYQSGQVGPGYVRPANWTIDR